MLSLLQASKKLKRTRERIRQLCVLGRIVGAHKIGSQWVTPDNPVIVPAKLRGRPKKAVLGVSGGQVAKWVR